MTMTGGGRLIVLEGAEGAGKSTQLELLRRALSAAGVDHVSFREPGGTAIGDAIRDLLLDPDSRLSAATEAHLFMASRAELCAQEIRPALARGRVVLLDRFFLSTYAYQVVGRGLPEDEIRAANRLATGGVVPDLTVLLDQPVSRGLERAAARGGSDRIERSAADFHQRVADAFRRFTDPAWMEAHPETGPIVRVDATGSRETVFERLVEALSSHLPGDFSVLRGTAAARGT